MYVQICLMHKSQSASLFLADQAPYEHVAVYADPGQLKAFLMTMSYF